jgi:hypothetical protein
MRIFSIFSVQSSRIGLRTPPSLPAISDLRPAQLRSIFSSFVGAMPRKSASPPPPGEAAAAAAAAGATTSGKRPADQPPELTPAQKALRSNSKPARAPEDSDKKVLISLLTSHTVQFSFQILIRLPAHFSLSLSHTHTHSSHSMWNECFFSVCEKMFCLCRQGDSRMLRSAFLLCMEPWPSGWVKRQASKSSSFLH